MPVASVTIGFSVPEEDLKRIERLSQRFAQGNRSAFLRLALRHMEVLDRAQRLRELQTFGVQHRDEVGLAETDVETIVQRVLAKCPSHD